MAGGGSSCSSCCHEACNRAAATARAAGQGKKKARARPGDGSVEVEVEATAGWLQSGITNSSSSSLLTPHSSLLIGAQHQRILHKPSCMSEGKP
jgi:hypothetical protein